ncbi:NhaC family Na+:H+ antiporter [Anaerosolibacter carboniphilus]|uniref:NhaC family Na+:H+ antiporter n=1 Tax=Anaerosolibacter carboniphilus TaxID=1417629 RepID=A0A841KQ61_9FIRM|nr:Na+/H+ antiporter NhaC family protein [Anaerosolibacter carboniphilus]MBB6215894.1 NhaC family Na+:H+ antiporter [Anaerosolibacter carboniphilus]
MKYNIIRRKDVYLSLIGTISFIALCIFFRYPLFIGLFGSTLLVAFIAVKSGIQAKQVMKMLIAGIEECQTVFMVIILIGMLIALWMASGIVPTMIYYGFNYIHQINYVLACFVSAALISLIMGTALGTVSTIGMVLLGMGRGLVIPSPILIGAIISGAFIADKVSPIGSLVNLTMKTTDVRYKDGVKSILVTLIPTMIISAVFYYMLGTRYNVGLYQGVLQAYQKGIASNFYISPILMILPIIVIVLAMMGVKIIPNMIFGTIGGIGFSLLMQNISLLEMIKIIYYGFGANTGMAELDQILKGGGILPMFEVILIVLGAVSLNSILEGTGMIRPMVDQLMADTKSKGNLIFKTGILSSLLTIITCDQTVGILLPGRFLKSKYEELNVDRAILARTIADTGTTIAPLIPWNVNAIIAAAITGVSAGKYGPYAVLCYISPVLTIIFGYLGTSTNKRKENVAE